MGVVLTVESEFEFVGVGVGDELLVTVVVAVGVGVGDSEIFESAEDTTLYDPEDVGVRSTSEASDFCVTIL